MSKAKIRKKKIFIPIVVVLLFIIGVFFLLQLKSQGKVSNELSDRSKEFIEGQSKEPGNEWSGVDFEGGNSIDTRDTIFNVDGCFSFKMLYRVYNQRIQGKCSGYYAFNNPKGSIVAYLKDASNISSVDSAEGVSFRRLSPEKYIERTKKINGKEFLIFKNIDEPYEVIAYHYFPDYYLGFVLKAVTTENLDKDLEKMLESIEFHKEVIDNK